MYLNVNKMRFSCARSLRLDLQFIILWLLILCYFELHLPQFSLRFIIYNLLFIWIFLCPSTWTLVLGYCIPMLRQPNWSAISQDNRPPVAQDIQPEGPSISRQCPWITAWIRSVFVADVWSKHVHKTFEAQTHW